MTTAQPRGRAAAKQRNGLTSDRAAMCDEIKTFSQEKASLINQAGGTELTTTTTTTKNLMLERMSVEIQALTL